MIAIGADGQVYPCMQMSGYYNSHGMELGSVKCSGLREGDYLSEVCTHLHIGLVVKEIEEYTDLSDEEYHAKLEAKREEITAFILKQCRTKRANLYITDPVASYFAQIFEICRLCDKDRRNAVGNHFMSELIDQLLQEGRLVTGEGIERLP